MPSSPFLGFAGVLFEYVDHGCDEPIVCFVKPRARIGAGGDRKLRQ
jgi:hypothetical protein